MAWSSLLATLVAAVAWGIVLAWLALGLPRLARQHARDLTAVFGLLGVALALRLVLPWGPLSFTEGERVLRSLQHECDFIWLHFPSSAHVVWLFWHGLGSFGLQILGPLFGAIGVGAAYLLARALGLEPRYALMAGIALLLWPAHARYSATLCFTTIGSALIPASFAVAVSPERLGRWAFPLACALFALVIGCRPEYLLLALPLGLCIWRAPWSSESVLGFLLLLGAAVARSTLMQPPSTATAEIFWGNLSPALETLFVSATVTPVWWTVAAVLGLLLGRAQLTPRLSIALGVVLLVATYALTRGDENPVWGMNRYFVSFIPLLAVASALAWTRLPSRWSRWSLPALVGLALLGSAVQASALVRPIDLQLENAYLERTTDEIAEQHTHLAVVTDRHGPHSGSWHPDESARLGLLIGAGRIPAGVCDSSVSSATLAWLPAASLLDPECAVDFEQVALFLGLYREPTNLEPLLRHFRFEPIHEQLDSAVATSILNTQCSRPAVSGGSATAPTCEIRLGWYHVIPKGAERDQRITP